MATLGDLLARITSEILNPLIVLVFLLAVITFGWGIVLYLAGSQGSDDRVQKAKKIMWWGIIGMFVLASMWGMVYLLCDFFGTCTGFSLPGSSVGSPSPGASTCDPPAVPPCFCDTHGFYHCPDEPFPGDVPGDGDPPGSGSTPSTLTVQQQIACLNSPSVCEPCRHFLDAGNPRAYVRCVKNILGF